MLLPPSLAPDQQDSNPRDKGVQGKWLPEDTELLSAEEKGRRLPWTPTEGQSLKRGKHTFPGFLPLRGLSQALPSAFTCSEQPSSLHNTATATSLPRLQTTGSSFYDNPAKLHVGFLVTGHPWQGEGTARYQAWAVMAATEQAHFCRYPDGLGVTPREEHHRGELSSTEKRKSRDDDCVHAKSTSTCV